MYILAVYVQATVSLDKSLCVDPEPASAVSDVHEGVTQQRLTPSEVLIFCGQLILSPSFQCLWR